MTFFPNYKIKTPYSNPDIFLHLAYLYVPCVHLVLVGMEVLCREYRCLFFNNKCIASPFQQGASIASFNNLL